MLPRGAGEKLEVVPLAGRFPSRAGQGIGLLGTQAGLQLGVGGGSAHACIRGIHIFIVLKTVRYQRVEGAVIQKNNIIDGAHLRHLQAGFEAGAVGQGPAVVRFKRADGEVAALVAADNVSGLSRRFKILGQGQQAGGAVAGKVGVGGERGGGGRVGEAVAQVYVGAAVGPAHVLQSRRSVPRRGFAYRAKFLRAVKSIVGGLAEQPGGGYPQQGAFREGEVEAQLAAVRPQVRELLGCQRAAARRELRRGQKPPVKIEPHKAPAVGISVVAVKIEVFTAMVEGHAAREFSVLAPPVAGVGAAVGAQALVFFEIDGDDARAALGIVLRRRVANQLDAFQLFGGQRPEVAGQLGAREGHALAVDNHQQALAAAQHQVVAGINGQAR